MNKCDTLVVDIASRLDAIHFSGEYCGVESDHPSACSNCYGPSPMSSLDVAREAVAVVLNSGWDAADDLHEPDPQVWRAALSAVIDQLSECLSVINGFAREPISTTDSAGLIELMFESTQELRDDLLEFHRTKVEFQRRINGRYLEDLLGDRE